MTSHALRNVPRSRRVTLTSKGQITLPIELRRHWDLKAGDQLDFKLEDGDTVRVRKVVRRSIFDTLKDLPPLSLGRPLTQQDIEDSITEAMEEQERRVRERSNR